MWGLMSHFSGELGCIELPQETLNLWRMPPRLPPFVLYVCVLVRILSFIYLFYVCACSACMYVCTLCACLVSTKARSKHQIPWTGVTDVFEINWASNMVLWKRCQYP